MVKIAQDNKDNEDFETVTPLMKKKNPTGLEIDWPCSPRKESDKIWKQFKDACNHYFDRLHAEKISQQGSDGPFRSERGFA